LVYKTAKLLQNIIALDNIFGIVRLDLPLQTDLRNIKLLIIVWILRVVLANQGNLLWHHRQVEKEFAHNVYRVVRLQHYKSPHFRVFNFQLIDNDRSQVLAVELALLYLLFFKKLKQDLYWQIGLCATTLAVLGSLLNEEFRYLGITIRGQL
jgi:hypothetical protein